MVVVGLSCWFWGLCFVCVCVRVFSFGRGRKGFRIWGSRASREGVGAGGSRVRGSLIAERILGVSAPHSKVSLVLRMSTFSSCPRLVGR